ncbi:MAG: RNA-guided endonuclease InsQ/TnpB family protein [Candidatus Hermodarchaeota archaeon]
MLEPRAEFEKRSRLYKENLYLMNEREREMTSLVQSQLNKKEQTKATIQATRERRKHQRCRVYELKIDTSHLAQETLKHLHTLFLQAKWFANAVIESADIFAFDAKVKEVTVKVGEEYEGRQLSLLSSQMKQGLLTQVQQDIVNLAKKKDKGQKVGKLKFKKAVHCIPLKQYDNTYYIRSETHQVRIQGLKKWMRVRGLKQIPTNVEFANAKLLQRQGDFYLHVTTYAPKQPKNIPEQTIGVDFGIKHQLTLSNGIKVEYNLLIPPRIRTLYRRLSRKQRGSKNYVKAKEDLQKAFRKWVNRKRDVTNKLTSLLTTQYQLICFQDDPITNWQRVWGRHVVNTNLGALLTNLKERSVTPCIVDQWSATTKRCSVCGHVLEHPLALSKRVFHCPECGFSADRDVNAAKSIEQLGLQVLDVDVPAGRRELTPLETCTSTQTLMDLLNQVPFVCASAVNERGSLTASA